MSVTPYKSASRSTLVVIAALSYTAFLTMVSALVGLIAPLGRVMKVIERHWGMTMMKMVQANVVVSGVENIDPGKTYIFISNHQSLFDIPLMMAFTPKQLRMIFKKELLYVPVFGFVLWLLKFIPIDRGNREKAIGSLHKAAQKIHGGINIVIYADGTRSLNGHLRPFKKGAFVLAIDAQVDIIPVTISGTIKILHKLQNMSDITFGQRVHLHFDPPISTAGLNPEDKDMLKNTVAASIAQSFESFKSYSIIDDVNLLQKVEQTRGS
ncbi:MAG: 1-acyl-sn-glycerol-3-phosphate acyltransferase [Bacteroidetes bacterium]|nr:1-acyl-sn-glycerol-3-phosphate acyltransferase [Bacteroidota bacterium]